MRRYLVIFLGLALLAGCDIDESMRAKARDGKAGNARALAAKGGCMGCHAVFNTVYGPAWQLVSERYQGMPQARSMLMERINQGSYGRWERITEGKRMPPQKGALNDEELGVVVDYILSLASEQGA